MDFSWAERSFGISGVSLGFRKRCSFILVRVRSGSFTNCTKRRCDKFGNIWLSERCLCICAKLRTLQLELKICQGFVALGTIGAFMHLKICMFYNDELNANQKWKWWILAESVVACLARGFPETSVRVESERQMCSRFSGCVSHVYRVSYMRNNKTRDGRWVIWKEP